MKTVGFVISRKENENRRAIVFDDAIRIKNKEDVFFESGYGNEFGVSDDDFVKKGFKIDSREKILKNCNVIVDPKIGDAEYLAELKGQTIFGWVHATQNYNIAQSLINGGLTAYAWEKMFENGKHTFYRNNEIAGEAAVLHSMLVTGGTYEGKKVALIGRGNTARGARRMLERFNAEITEYYRNQEEELRNKIGEYDVVVNCILWDTSRNDHIIYETDLARMKPGAIIVDVSCDKNGGIETSVPTTIDDPVYERGGVLHYVVDHTPSLLYKDATRSISAEVVKYVDLLVAGEENEVLKECKIVEAGNVIDEEINEFQGR